jgi:hypothetical protein
MIGHSANAEGFRLCVAADGRQAGVHSRPGVAVQPWIAVSGAENNMNDDLA